MKKKPIKKSNPVQGKSLNKASGTLLKKVSAVAKGVVQAMSPKSVKKHQVKAKKPLPQKGVVPKALPVKNASLKNTPVKAAAAKPAAPASVKGPQGKKGAPPVKAPPVKAGSTKSVEPVKAAKTSATGKASKAAKAAAQAENMCRENGCENHATTKGFCRLDYIKNWKKIKRKEMILKEGKLNQYIEELVSKYPDKYIEVIRQDLSTELSFNKVIHDLELDESIDDLEYDGDSIDSLIGSIRKEGEGFGEDEF